VAHVASGRGGSRSISGPVPGHDVAMAAAPRRLRRWRSDRGRCGRAPPDAPRARMRAMASSERPRRALAAPTDSRHSSTTRSHRTRRCHIPARSRRDLVTKAHKKHTATTRGADASSLTQTVTASAANCRGPQRPAATPSSQRHGNPRRLHASPHVSPHLAKGTHLASELQKSPRELT